MKYRFISIIVVLAIYVSFFGVLSLVNAANFTTSTSIGNTAPVFTVTPSDGGSDNGSDTGDTAGNPTNVGSNITFTATAKDINADQYYLIICSTDAVVVGDNDVPTCTEDTWAVSTATDSEDSVTITYTTIIGDSESNNWYAFVCDKLSASSGPACYPATGDPGGDQGRAIGTINFSDVPDDEDNITIDSVQYRFDTVGDGCVGLGTCIDISGNASAADSAKSLADAEIGVNSYAVNLGNITYVYANNAGISGNSIVMSIGTCSNCTLSGAALFGGSDENASPFYVNHSGAFDNVSFTDTSGGSIEPGDTVRFTITQAGLMDIDTSGGQDTMNMYICSSESDMGGVTTSFDYTTNTCVNGALLCSDIGVDPTSEDAVCDDAQNIVSIPTAHGSYDVKVYVEDNHSLAASGTTIQSFIVQDTVPVLISYTATDEPAPTAGGSDTVDFTVVFTDDNGDNDVTLVEGVFFDDSVVTNSCTSNENNCIRDTNCVLSDQSIVGTGKTSTGTDALLSADCQVTVWFNANASDFDVQAQVDDDNGTTDFIDAGVSLTNAALSAIDVVESAIEYGSLTVNNASDGRIINIGNVGNQIIDVLIEGDDMCTDYPVCAGDVIPVSQQKWHNDSIGFNWDDTSVDPGPWILVDSANVGSEVNGCINRDIAVRNEYLIDNTNELIYLKIKIPVNQEFGSYTGSNTFSATASTSCTGTLH